MIDLEARPGPAGPASASTHHTPVWFPTNVARNSPNNLSNFEIGSLQFQRFQGISKTDRGKLRATFRGGTVAPAGAGPARPRDRHTRAFGSEWSISKPGQALQAPRRPRHTTHIHYCLLTPACSLMPAPAHTHMVPRTPAWFPTNVARNSPTHISNFEIGSLQFQRFLGTSKTDQGKLRASFWDGPVAPGRRSRGVAERTPAQQHASTSTWGLPGAPTCVAALQPQYANPFGCSAKTANPGSTTSKPLAL